MTYIIATTALGLSRLLWSYGEDQLWHKARGLAAEAVATIGQRAGQLESSRESALIWPGGPRYAGLLIASIEFLEGSGRRAARGRRRSAKLMPSELVASEAERWADPMLQEVSRILDERTAPKS